ncbi:MAG: hypothetical protein MR765_06335 [Tenericutes bacterium]|nr:hypothetical protein [Mycoplasmatota bacterium]
MKKKTKRKMIIFIVILTFIFPIMVKVLDLNYEQMLLCVTFISLISNAVSDFNLRGALLAKLSIIT